MSYRDRLALVASFLVLPIAGIAMNSHAESDEQPITVCTKEAEESGLTGSERDEYIKDCIQNLQDSSDK